jgi:hypothetical protein
MGLSRLQNFIRSTKGTILYVDPNSLDATDSIENDGASLTRPFKTIQRALIESARWSYQKGLNNDRFEKTTILLFPGDHIVDNRPGWIPDNSSGSLRYRLRSGFVSTDFRPLDLTSRFDLSNANNQLYKFNSVHGGVIIPRGTSIVGLDLRKTKIRPLYVPNPTNKNIERSCIFRLTGGSYLWQFSMFDADPNGVCYFDYTENTFVPNFSHHKLTCFEYADGVNPVIINDTFISGSAGIFDRTDLDMYYEKIGIAYGEASDREILNDYPSLALDIQPKIDEYRIVGSTGETTGILNIRSGNGDGTGNNKIITVTTTTVVPGLDVDTPFRVEGVSDKRYNGQFVVSEKLSDTQLQYQLQNAPENPLPSVVGSSITLTSDTVTSASPYIFNVSLRSVYGMCGVFADGSKATGFRSMVIAQFTGISLQKDDNAFVVYDPTIGIYQDSTVAGNETISTNSRSTFKPQYRNFHIKAVNDAFIQNVSVFAIGFAEHFSVESGGDMSITNSNSNFGAKALVSSGFRNQAFPQDDQGYITHIIPPKEFSKKEIAIEFNAIDVNATVGVASTGNLYLYNQINSDVPPQNVLEGYRIGARENDTLRVSISSGGTPVEYRARIVMPNSQTSSEKQFFVARSNVGINSIANNTFTFTQSHSFINGESIRILSESGQLPDGLTPNTVYYAITTGVANQIRIAKTLNDALSYNLNNQTNLIFNEKGGSLNVVSRVSDKNPGDIGHPIQFDITKGQWFIRVATASSENNIYPTLVNLGSGVIGQVTSRTYVNRFIDDRNAIDTIYRVRYVIPSTSLRARPPSDGFIIQESNSTIAPTNEEIQTYFGTGTHTNINQLRNPKFIANATWNSSSNVATITTELPHNLSVGSQVQILNIRSTNNTSATKDFGFNGIFTVSSVNHSKQFSYNLNINPGIFTSDTTTRTTTLPYFRRKRYNNTYYIHRTQEVQKFTPGEQDGIYYLTLINASNSPTIAPFTDEKFSQPVKELYPQVNRDNPVSDPEETKSFASSSLIGEVIVNDVRNSLTKETINKTLKDNSIGIGLTGIRSASTTNHTIFTSLDHNFNRITRVNITNPGSGYGLGVPGDYYNATLVGFAGSTVGQYATAKVTLDNIGRISNIKIMDGGSAYGIGNTLTVTGIGTTTGFSPAVITVSNIYNNVGDVVKITGVTSTAYRDYNNLYRITEVNVGAAKSFRAVSASAVSGISTAVVPVFTANAVSYVTGQAILVSALSYENTSGIATITTVNYHGLKVDNKIRISGANQSLYNGEFIVTKNINLNSFSVRIGVSTNAPTATGTIFVYREGLTSNDGFITRDNENLNGRMIPIYAGITTTLSAPISNTFTDEINILNSENLDINIGDYLAINDEIVRVKANTSNISSAIFVIRGVLGTRASNHAYNSVVRKIRVNPIELRRHSIMRASGHTFEYVGYGPGNYSTAFPDKQDRQISSQEELLAQSTRKEGGINFFTGMNDKGISYAGNKKLSTVTGQEEIFDTPVQTVTGEDIGNLPGLNVITPIEGDFIRSIRVGGGPDGRALSKFNGPVVFSNKVTSTSPNGLEATSLFLQGEETVSRKYTIGISTPSLAGNTGDVVFNARPNSGQNVGWIYATDNTWKQFGWINNSLYGVGISTNSGPIGFSTMLNIVGIGLTISKHYDSKTGITTVYFEGDPINTIGISSEGTFIGDARSLNFVGSDDGFGFNISVAYNSAVGLATIKFDAPVDIIDFKVSGDGNLGYANPSFATTSLGTRIIYENRLDTTNTNYAVGIGADDALWWSVPQNNSYGFKWYGGTTEIASLLSTGALTILGSNSTVTSGRFISTVATGTSPISVASSTLVSNLNANYLDGFISAATTTPNTIVRRDASNIINGNVSHLIHNTSGSQRGEWYTDIPARLGYTPFNRAGDTCTGGARFVGLTTITQVSDIYKNQTSTGTTLTCDFATGPITRTTSTNITTININNVPTTNERAFNHTVIINTATTVSNLASIQFQINGTPITSSGSNRLRWLNNILPTGTAAGYYFFGFTIFRVESNWEVIAVFATYT